MAFGNAAYMYLSVAFIQMLKAGTPVVVMMMLSLSGVEYMSPQVGFSTMIMAGGTLLTSLGEVKWHTLGFILMMLSELTEAGRCVITQHVLKVLLKQHIFVTSWLFHKLTLNTFYTLIIALQNLKFSVLESQYYLSPGTYLLFPFYQRTYALSP